MPKSPSLQVAADWTTRTTPAAFEEEFKFPFVGPGFYLTESDTLLVLVEGREADKVWSGETAADSILNVYVYNCNFRDTLFSKVAVAPTRGDLRA